MFWQVRAVLEDRPGAMAALAARCGKHEINILALQIFPTTGGEVVDEIILSTPPGWSAEQVQRLCSGSGVVLMAVACSARTLEDQPVRYLRAARAILEDATSLETSLSDLLAASPLSEGRGRETLVLDDESGPPVMLGRNYAFTDTEIARASELRRLAVAMGWATRHVQPAARDIPTPADSRPILRPGSVEDVDLVIAMHERCSAASLHRRYHVPSPRTSASLARRLLEPIGGWSVVAQAGDHLVGIGLVAGEDAEVGLLVEDGWQGQALGAALLDALVKEAAERDIEELTCLTLPENPAVARTIHRAGLRARAGLVDGLVSYTIPVRARTMRRPGGRRVSPGKVTVPLVALLHGRQELRELYPAADFVDCSVRD